MNLIFLGIILIIILVIAFKLIRWNIGTKDTSDPTENAEGYNTEALDNIVPLDATHPDHHKEGPLDILFLGNGQLAEDKDSEDNLANIVARKTGATVYNAAIDGSFMSMKNDHYKNKFVYDAFCFYNLTTLFTVDNQKLFTIAAGDWEENTGEPLPQNAADAIDMINSINFDDIDIICIYYDAQDYFEQRAPHGDELETSDVHTYSGSFEAGIDLIKQYLPDIRIIVLSPTFVYKDKNGEKLSCYDPKAGKYSLETYVTMEQTISYIKSVSFVDNFYGSIHGENADQYLIDNYHLNRAGTELLADRFIYALNRFNEYDFSAYQ